MTILDTSSRKWDITPKRRIVTSEHRVRYDPTLGKRVAEAQGFQSAVYDATLEELDRHGGRPWQAPAGKASLCKWVTGACKRISGERPGWRKMTLNLARGAAEQALLAWNAKDA